MDEDAASRRRFSWAHVLFGVAAVAVVAFTVIPFSAYGAGSLTGALAFGFVVRLVYVKLRRGAGLAVWSGWILVIALLPALASQAERRNQAIDQSSSAAVRQGVVASKDAATPVDRCVGLALDTWDANWASRSRLPRRTVRIYTRRVCTRAGQDGVLREDGGIPPASQRSLGNEVAVEMRAEGLLP
jgi:hypothetical protein